MHPYSNLPERNFWNKFVPKLAWRELILTDDPKFRIKSTDRISTAGSCFAQHIARYMEKIGLAPYVVEQPHPHMIQFGGNVASYKLFSARYGNVYTARQCLELFRQAFGRIPIIQDFVEENGACYDLLRPNILPEGFETIGEAIADRTYHLGCVKKMFETSDVFVFTLGLTESWYNAQGGHTYPVCPGTARGTYRPDKHCFRNFTCAEVIADLDELIGSLREVNPNIRIILTVSPVPLVATYTGKNVLIASSHSKSVLRAACGEVDARYDHVQYFPSYEIINHVASFGQYLESDLRGVAERGVAHVMEQFFTSFYGPALERPQEEPLRLPVSTQEAHSDAVSRFFQVECDELFNEILK